jgi:hypothetical protein
MTYRARIRTPQSQPPLREIAASPPRASWPLLTLALLAALVCAAAGIFTAVHGG